MKGRLVLALWCSLMSGQVFRLNNPLAKVQDVLHDCNTDKIFGGLGMLERKERKTRTPVVSGLSPKPRLYRVQNNKGWQFSSGFLQTANFSQK